jgi:hypothetical protein
MDLPGSGKGRTDRYPQTSFGAGNSSSEGVFSPRLRAQDDRTHKYGRAMKRARLGLNGSERIS